MKNSRKGLFLILAIIVSLVAVQGVCAETFTLTGTVSSYTASSPYTIELKDADGILWPINGVNFIKLNQRNGIEIVQFETTITIDGNIIDPPDEEKEDVYKACYITVGDTTITLTHCLVLEE